jgi:HPt (histidine-containing phosphotransfer) domain-containing protein
MPEQCEKDPLRSLIAELGAKFLHRTRGEAVVLRELIECALLGDATVIDQLEQLAHRIHGTGATFGFAAVSACAAEIEHLVEGLKGGDNSIDAAIQPQRLQHLLQCTRRLAEEVEAAAAL